MANTLAAVIPQLLVQGLMALRENARTVAFVNNEYQSEAGKKGSTIDVPIPSAIVDVDVTPANIAPNPGDLTPTSVPLPMNFWREAAFQMSDKDQLEAQSGTLPMQASEAIKALANFVDKKILGLYPAFYGATGTPGVTPFTDGTTNDGAEFRRLLNVQLAPPGDRTIVFDPDAETKALNLRAFQDYGWNQDLDAIREGKINKRLGMMWEMNQNVLDHTAGSAAAYQINGTPSIGDTTIPIDTGSGNFVRGDIITFAGHTQQYSIQADVASVAAAITISPALRVAVPDDAVLSYAGDHVVNLGFQRGAIAFASRPLQAYGSQLGVISRSAVDPISGLTLRVEVKHEYKRLRWSYDILFGTEVIRADLGGRMFG